MTEQSNSEQGAAPPAAPSPSTSGTDVDAALAPKRVRPTKLTGRTPTPVDEGKPERVGPVKLSAKRPRQKE